MSDYTLLEAGLELGGVVRSVTVCERREASPVSADPRQSFHDGADPERVAPCYDVHTGVSLPDNLGDVSVSSLSTLHICPHIEFRAGASVLKSHRGGSKDPAPIGGIRGEVKGFSVDSRRRLLRTVASVRRDAVLPLFITLTYPLLFPDAMSSKRHLRMFLKRLDRYLKSLGVVYGLIWKLEPQERGAPHYHLLIWGCELSMLLEFVPNAWFAIAGGGDLKHLTWHMGGFGNQHCVQQVHDYKGVLLYASKYLGKTFEVAGWSDKWTGRFWGVVHRDCVPFGDLVHVEVTSKKALEVLRYEKRFSGLKVRNKKSLTIFCDVDQWVEKIGLLES